MTRARDVASHSLFDSENRVINGAFDFWQRGVSGTALGYVAADRWRNVGNAGTNTQSRQNFNVGDKLGINCPQHFLRQTTTGTSGVGDFAITTQRIENVRTYAGETITVLGWAKRASGAGNTAVSFVQNFGTGGSPSAEVYGVGQQVALTGVWTPFAAQMALPSVSSRTFGTNNDSYLEIEFWTSAGSNFNSRSGSLGIQTVGVDLWGIHIRLGTHTVSAVDLYRQPELGPELARCQRYYEKSFATGVAPANNLGTVPSGAETLSGPSNGGGFSPNMYWNIRFKVVKRAIPTFIAFNPLADSPNTWRTYASGAAAETTVTPEMVSTNGVGGIVARASASLALGAWTADAEL